MTINDSKRRGGVPTPNDLRTATQRLAYEYGMVAHLHDALEEMRQQKERGLLSDRRMATWNALLESFGLHARVMYTFLCTPIESADRRDVVAEDYLDRSNLTEWRRKYEPYAEWLADERDKIDRQVVHIRRASIGGAVKEGHEYSNLAMVLFKLADKFVKRVPENLLGDRWSVEARATLEVRALALNRLGPDHLRNASD